MELSEVMFSIFSIHLYRCRGLSLLITERHETLETIMQTMHEYSNGKYYFLLIVFGLKILILRYNSHFLKKTRFLAGDLWKKIHTWILWKLHQCDILHILPTSL